MSSLQSRAKAQMRRHTGEGQQARRMYNAKPEVKYRRALKRAMKLHQAPPAIKF